MLVYQVDAFSSAPFTGNPAGVCPLEAPAPASWMQRIAAEMNASETAFTYPLPDGRFRLRWFTPSAEVDLCGHATLATAHVIGTAKQYPGRNPHHLLPGEKLRFATNSGELSAVITQSDIELDFPAKPAHPTPPPPGLSEALHGGVRCVWTGASAFDLVIEVPDATAVRAVEPRIAALATSGHRGVIVTAVADPDAPEDFVSRFFAPAVGVPEDPVTGSAHCTLAPFRAQRLGRDELLGYQASERGGYVSVALRGDRVLLRGSACTVFVGELVAAAQPPPLRD